MLYIIVFSGFCGGEPAHRIVKIRLLGKATLVALPALLLLAACAPTTLGPTVGQNEIAAEAAFQRKLYVEARIARVRRLANVSYPLMRGAADLCGRRVSYKIGVRSLTKSAAKGDLARAMRTVLKLRDAPTIIAVATGSPADRAGLRVGDVILSIGGKCPVDGDESTQSLPQLIAQSRGNPIIVKIARDGGENTVSVTPEKLCQYPVLLVDRQEVNAFADSKKIVVYAGLMRMASTDAELGLVIAHELAHNIMGHIAQKEANAATGAAVGLVFDVLGALAGVNTNGAFARLGAQSGAGAFSKAFESEADYVGLYLMARAHLDYKQAPAFWRRMATLAPVKNEAGIAATHPVTPKRFVLLRKTIAEIDKKIAEGAPLTPNIRKTRSVGAYADTGAVRGSQSCSFQEDC